MKTTLALVLPSLLVSTLAAAQMGDPEKVTLKTSAVAGSVSVIEGANGFAGGNVGVSAGDDGVFVIDDELKPMTDKLKAELAKISKKPVRFLINTHWHGDHTGGNLGMAATGAVIVAHDNVRKRLSVDQFIEMLGEKKSFPAAPPAALPVITFNDEVTFHLNGDDIRAFHVAPAHTDGDSIVHFKKANVVHMGDAFMSAGYPLVDIASGGAFPGFIAAADRVLALSDGATRIIPGHGPVVGRAELKTWRDMLFEIDARVRKLLAEKKTLDQIKAAKPSSEFDAKWGQGYVKADLLVEFIVRTTPKSPAR